ncbi:hypothetical protein CC86DRAFT_466693 [Ophiobolus disseminans]|uniref:Uncharacterized protein n=1 Tax=Ophiobolus disseminans TaxID=1469910 RepID=A0A6A7A0X5_9PLEO|nr:hypothetical protein CC86DRAFT_466693 [Ophiobolus disseminans]
MVVASLLEALAPAAAAWVWHPVASAYSTLHSGRSPATHLRADNPVLPNIAYSVWIVTTWCPCIVTSFDVVGHAHPSPERRDSVQDEVEKIHDLIIKVRLDVVLRRLPADDASSVCGPLMPRVRRSSISVGPAQHLDTVSCWKGLSHQQTLELVAWERVFRDSLASQLKHHLQDGLAAQLLKYSDPMNEALLVPRMLESINPRRPLTMVIDMTSLIHRMIARLYEDDCTDTATNKLTWSMSTGELPSFVYNFVRTHDCITFTSEGPRVTFNVSPSYSNSILTVFGEAQWQLRHTTFSALPTRLSYGDMYSITPQCEETSSDTYLGFSPYKTITTYSASNPSLPLQWDFNHECFHAPVLFHLQYGQSDTLETTLGVKVTTPFHADVRFERVSRYRIKLDVCERNEAGHYENHDNDNPCASAPTPPASHSKPAWVPSYTSTPQSKIMRPATKAPRNQEEAEAFTRVSDSWMASLHFDNHLRMWAYPSIEMERDPPVKRKASRQMASPAKTHGGSFALDKFEHLDLELDTKRRKLEQNDEPDVHMIFPSPSPVSDDVVDTPFANLFTGPMGEAQTSPTSNSPCWFEKLDDTRVRTLPRSFAASLSSTRQTMFPWKSGGEGFPHSPSDGSSSHEISGFSQKSGTSRNSLSQEEIQRNYREFKERNKQNVVEKEHPMAATPDTSRTSLSQEEIQRNYREFEERMKQKAAEKEYYMATIPGFDGVVSPTEDDDNAFERVFLEGSEQSDWESEVSVLSEGMASVCMDHEVSFVAMVAPVGISPD